MDFILFLIFAGVVFLITAKPFQRRKDTDSATPTTIQNTYSPEHPKQSSARLPVAQTVSRPSDPILLGIEITASQQRRLGKNDPSVLAAQRAKQLYMTSQSTPTFFEQMRNQIEQAVKQVNETAQQHPPLSRTTSQSYLNKMFENLFSK